MFYEGWSCLSSLLEFVAKIITGFVISWEIVGVVFLDFVKAFKKFHRKDMIGL